jgi:hypothetical protein
MGRDDGEGGWSFKGAVFSEELQVREKEDGKGGW